MTTATRAVFDPEGRSILTIDEGEGPAVIVLPGRGLNVAYLGAFASVLVEQGFRVVRVGVRRGGDAASMHDLAGDVLDVMTSLEIDDAWIVGHGFGGALARTIALDQHDRVNGIALIGVTTPDEPATALAQTLQALEAVDAASDAPADLRVLVGDRVNLALAWAVYAGSRDAQAARVQDAALAATPTAHWATVPQGLPVLVIQGESDEVTPRERAEALRESAPDRVSVTRIPDAGYLAAMTHPGDVAFGVEDYLGWD